MYDDGCMYVYGGYSQRCEDYCDDMWLFDIYLQVASQPDSQPDSQFYSFQQSLPI